MIPATLKDPMEPRHLSLTLVALPLSGLIGCASETPPPVPAPTEPVAVVAAPEPKPVALAPEVSPRETPDPVPSQGADAPAGYVRIEAGSFEMGSPESESGRAPDELQHTVQLTRAYWLKETPVTQGEWVALMERNPSNFQTCGADCPVERVSWRDAVTYLNKLSLKEGLEPCYEDGRFVGDRFKGLDCTGYRLPTEAEWEHAARAGTDTRRYGELTDIAWYVWNSGGTPHPVAKKQKNAWGLYDMLGNVWEWCQDWYGPYDATATDPMGPPEGIYRVFRGGSWLSDEWFARAANRYWSPPGLGFARIGLRPARTIK
jgi:formylglycine-generating enzyme required for sulfatase activity